MPGKKKQDDIDEALLQGISLHQLKQDIENLQRHLRILNDRVLESQIKRIINELDAFDKVLKKRKSYTPEQVEALAKHIGDFAVALEETLRQQTEKALEEYTEVVTKAKDEYRESKAKAQEKFERSIAPLTSAGEAWFTDLLIDYHQKEMEQPLQILKKQKDQKVSKAKDAHETFHKSLTDAKLHLENTTKNIQHLKTKSPGYERSSLDKLSHACHRVRKSITSFYKTTVEILSHGINASIFKTAKNKLPAGISESTEEEKAQIFRPKKR